MGLTSARRLGALMLTSALVAFTGGAAQAAFECPVTGGDLVFGQEAKVNSLDMHASSTISTRNVAMHMFESLMTRDEDNNPILELAEAVDVSDDGMIYTFKLREGIKFHNGKQMTSDDVAASFDRYKKVGIERVILNIVARWEAPGSPHLPHRHEPAAADLPREPQLVLGADRDRAGREHRAPIRSSSSRSAPARWSSSSSSPTATSSSSATTAMSPTSSTRTATASAATRSPASTP